MIVLKYVLLFAISFSAYSKNWSKTICPSNNESYAKEAIKIALSGINLSIKSKCLSQKDYEFISSRHWEPGDATIHPDIYLTKKYRIEIKKIEDNGLGQVKIHFTIIDKNESYDEFVSILLRGNDSEPCGLLFDLPEKNYFIKSCEK
jgi:hypothetical protein